MSAVSSPTALTLQFSEEPARADQMIIEDAAGDVEQVGHEGVPERIPDRRTFLVPGDDALTAKHGELLRHDGLVERQSILQFLHSPPSLDEELYHADPRGVGQRSEELGLEALQFAGHREVAVPAMLRHS